MAAPILVTKLFIPPTRASRVYRSDLIERLNDGLDRNLTLLSAPAGFGKTTLVSNWVENLRDNTEISDDPIRVAWLSLDQDDNDPVRFLTYFITALSQIKEIIADLGQGALSMLQSPQPPAANSVLITLINQLVTIPEKIQGNSSGSDLSARKPAASVALSHRYPPRSSPVFRASACPGSDFRAACRRLAVHIFRSR